MFIQHKNVWMKNDDEKKKDFTIILCKMRKKYVFWKDKSKVEKRDSHTKDQRRPLKGEQRPKKTNSTILGFFTQ